MQADEHAPVPCGGVSAICHNTGCDFAYALDV